MLLLRLTSSLGHGRGEKRKESKHRGVDDLDIALRGVAGIAVDGRRTRTLLTASRGLEHSRALRRESHFCPTGSFHACFWPAFPKCRVPLLFACLGRESRKCCVPVCSPQQKASAPRFLFPPSVGVPVFFRKTDPNRTKLLPSLQGTTWGGYGKRATTGWCSTTPTCPPAKRRTS